MKKVRTHWLRLAMLGLALIAVLGSVVVLKVMNPAKAHASGSFSIQGTKIVDPNGNEFIPIGANMDGYGWVWAGNTPGDADAVAKGWKFNIIRVNMIWGCNPNPQYPPGGPYQNTDPSFTDNVVNAYTSRGIVVLLSNHDNTSGMMPTGSELSCDIQHWTDLANKYKGNTYVWFNMFNEPGVSGGLANGNNPNWISSHQQTIQAIRGTGAPNLLVADGTGWGQDKDCSNVDAGSAIIAGGQQVLSADSTGNTLFSFHSYGWGAANGCTGSVMGTYIDHVHAKNLALIEGEVGNYSDANNYNTADSDAIRNSFNVALPRHVGPIGWHGMAGDGFCMYWNGSNCDIGNIDSYTNPSRQPAPSQGNGLTWIGALFWDATHGGGYGLGSTPTPVATPTNTPTPPSGTTTIDDSTSGSGQNQFNYHGNWQHCTNCGSELYNNSNSWDSTTNDYLTIAFTGTQIKYYAVVDAHHGIGAFSIDGGSETNVDFYAATRAGNVLLYTSPVLSSGSHTLKLRVTGTKDSNSTDVVVTADRADILTGQSQPSSTTVDDSVSGTGTNQFNYTGQWGHCTSCSPSSYYNSSHSWSNEANDTVTITFNGTGIKFYAGKGTNMGYGAVSIDSGSETTLDFYANVSSETGNVLFWTSPMLSSGTHTFKLRLTGTHDSSSSNTYVVLDRVVILS